MITWSSHGEDPWAVARAAPWMRTYRPEPRTAPGPVRSSRAVTALLFAGAAAAWHAVLTAFDRHSRAAWVAVVVWCATGAVGRLGGGLLAHDVGVLGLGGGGGRRGRPRPAAAPRQP